MVKTLVEIRDDLYRELVKLSLNLYNHPRAISKVLNMILENYFGKKKNLNINYTLDIELNLSPEELEKLIKEAIKEYVEEKYGYLEGKNEESGGRH